MPSTCRWSVLAVVLAALPACRTHRSGADAHAAGAGAADAAPPAGRLIVLALDGMDLARLQQWAADGHLPNFARLLQRGEISPLRTTAPPTCEAAWTALVTGLPPAESGVAGPARIDHATYGVRPGAVDVSADVAPPQVVARRSGTAFWTALAGRGVRVRVLWAPYEVPPERLEGGEVLAGAGVPDLAGTPGRATLLGAAFPEGVAAAEAFDRVRLLPSATGWAAALPGPHRPGGGANRLVVPLEIRRTADPARLAVTLPGVAAELPVGAWGPRLPVSFAAGELRIDGLARFLALDASGLPLLLAAPVEIAPEAPWFPISEPPSYAADLARRYGRVPTLGTPGDLGALDGGVLSEEAFLADLADDLAARSRVLLGELDRGGFDFLFAWVPTVERVTLGLRRLADRDHPRFDEARAMAVAPGFGGVRLSDAELAAYAYVDDLVGKVAGRLGPDDVLLVVSDHGEHAWHRSAHLDAWLQREGLLVLQRPGDAGPPPTLEGLPGLGDVDWTRTDAYAVGGPYINVNLRDREGQGAVEPGERYDAIVARIGEKLRRWTDDAAGGTPIVRDVLVRGRELRGRREDALPDLMVVFADGWRESPETDAGEIPDDVVGPNRSLLGADHGSGAAAELAGFVFSTRPFVQGDPALEDVGATALGFFGVADAARGGRDLWHPPVDSAGAGVAGDAGLP